MVDIFALALSHGLIALAVWRLLARGDLDADTPASGIPDAPAADAGGAQKAPRGPARPAPRRRAMVVPRGAGTDNDRAGHDGTGHGGAGGAGA